MKKNISKLANLTLKYLDSDDRDPEDVFYTIKHKQLLNFLLDILTPRDLVILCFLTILMKKGEYKEGMELVIDQFLFSYSVIQFKEQTNRVDCDYCDGDGVLGCSGCSGEGYNDCTQCNGSGDQTCSTCDGDGEDDEGNTCDDCQGGGEVTCEECDGDGKIECSDCGGSGNEDCWQCDGNGYKYDEEHIPFTVTTYLSWNPKYREKLRELSDSEKNIGINSKFLVPDISMRIRTSEFNHTDVETTEIGEEYQNGTYIGGIQENPGVNTYGNNLWVSDPTPEEKFKG